MNDILHLHSYIYKKVVFYFEIFFMNMYRSDKFLDKIKKICYFFTKWFEIKIN